MSADRWRAERGGDLVLLDDRTEREVRGEVTHTFLGWEWLILVDEGDEDQGWQEVCRGVEPDADAAMDAVEREMDLSGVTREPR